MDEVLTMCPPSPWLRSFNGPDDIPIKSGGAVYLTDDDIGLRGPEKSPQKELQHGVWLIKDGVTRRLLTDTQLGLPNGITLSADEKPPYLSAGTRMMCYPVKPDDTLGPGSLFTEVPGIGDGMRSDSLGNSYFGRRRSGTRAGDRPQREVPGRVGRLCAREHRQYGSLPM
jgi:sugar lactone lactonase YvrE